MTRPRPIAEIVSTGRYLPDRVLTNADWVKMVDTTDQWIQERTGIRERRLASPCTSVCDMGTAAAQQALERAGVTAKDVDLLLVSTATPDRLLPSTACDIQARLGASKAAAMDISAACTGFLYILALAEGYIASGMGEVVLVVSTEKMTSIMDWEDRSTAVLFGDGAGAGVVRRATGDRGILANDIRSDGNFADLLQRPGGGARRPFDESVLADRSHLLKMEGREVFKNAVRAMSKSARHAIRQAGWTSDDVDLLIPHQANIRIIEATARYARVPMDKVYVNVHRYGNISSATVPVALDEAAELGRIGPGSNVLLVAFGAGLTWGATAIRL